MTVVVFILKFLHLIPLKTYNLTICLLFIFSISFSQNSEIDKLKNLRTRYAKEINNAQKLLEKKGKSKTNSLNDLQILNSKINSQENIINTYKNEIIVITSIIDSNQVMVDHLSKEIAIIRKGYEKLILEANKQVNSNYNEFMLLFSSSTFSEAYRRFTLMKQYSSYRKKQGLILIDTKNQYDSIILINQSILTQKQETFQKLNQELENLKLSINQKKYFISELSKEERNLKREINNKKKHSEELERSIEKLILEASKNKSNFTFSNFGQAKGKLSWPVEGGIVTSNFGEHNHAVLKGVKIKNNGIDITVNKDNTVNSVYEGTVSRVIAIPGYNKAVIIRHGKYITVYANLVNVFVKSGELIKSSQGIGQIYAEENSKNGILHFEIWEENKKINPTTWLLK